MTQFFIRLYNYFQRHKVLFYLSLCVCVLFMGYAKRDWRDNVIVHRNMKKALDDLLFDYMEDQKLDWPLDTIDIIIDEIMMVAKKGY